MKLIRALRITSPPKIAFVGAGGKTTATFRLAHELLSGIDLPFKCNRVIITTSTHLNVTQLTESDHHLVVNDSHDLERFLSNIPTGMSTITGSEIEEGKVTGLTSDMLNRLGRSIINHEIPILIEADGSRQRPLKAPAMHEPVIPEWVDNVVVLAGMSGVSKLLNDHYVHRPEIFANITGIAMEDSITIQAVGDLLIHPKGGLKNIPDGARRVVLLNQADSSDLQSEAYYLSKQVLNEYHSVIISTLNPPEQTKQLIGEKEKLLLWEKEVHAVLEPTAGIILAAGGAERMGSSKLLLPLSGEPLINHVIREVLQSSLSQVVVVLGGFRDELMPAIMDQPISLVFNQNWRNGQSTSIIAGLETIQSKVGSVIFILADQPFITSTLIRNLIEEHAKTLNPIVAPMIDGQRGNPVLFDRSLFPDLMNLSGDEGGRSLFSKHQISWLPWNNPLSLLDVDTPGDYEKVKTAWNLRS